MSEDSRSDRESDFFRAFRRWGERPSGTAPRVAARRVLGALPEPRAPFRPWLLAASAAVMLLAFLALWQVGWRPQPTVVAAATLEPLADNVVLWYVEPETPVYFVLGPPATGGGSS
jgi:hypothetical protein